MTTVAITQNRDDIGEAIARALAHTPLERLVRGKLVAIKPNDTWATADDTSGVTQADTLRAVLQEVKRFGPRGLVVTGGAGAAETEDVFRHSGMLDVVREEEAEFFDHNRPPLPPLSPLDQSQDPNRSRDQSEFPCRRRPRHLRVGRLRG